MTTRKPLKRPLGDTEYLLEQWGCPGRQLPGAGSFGPWPVPGAAGQ